MASLGQLTAGIAHEIKNPLNFVNNFASLSVELLDELKEAAAPALAALDEDKRAEVDETIEMLTGNLEKIAEHGKRADNIVKSMLEHSRGGSGERREVDLNALVEEALNLAYHGARAQDQNFNITLERDYGTDIAPDRAGAAGDDARLPQPVRQRLLRRQQARSARHGDGSFQPVLDRDDARSRRGGRGPGARQRHRHPARDQGQAVPAVLHHQADRRGHRARPVDQLRHRHATAWRHDHGRQRGRRVHRVHRPPAAALRGQRGSGFSGAEAHERQHPGRRRRARCRRPVPPAVSPRGAARAPMSLHFAHSGEEALERLAGEIEPQLIVILSDINMPGMDGLALLREIKTRRPDLPVMMVTAYGDDERRRRAAEFGAAEFLTKPVDFDLLKEQLRQLHAPLA